jgi:hypothetical protein
MGGGEGREGTFGVIFYAKVCFLNKNVSEIKRSCAILRSSHRQRMGGTEKISWLIVTL